MEIPTLLAPPAGAFETYSGMWDLGYVSSAAVESISISNTRFDMMAPSGRECGCCHVVESSVTGLDDSTTRSSRSSPK